MRKDTVLQFEVPGEFKDQLTEILRQGAQRLILEAVEAEFTTFLESHGHERLEDGRRRIVRLGICHKGKWSQALGAYPLRFLDPGIGKAIRKKEPFSLPLSWCPPMCGVVKVWRLPFPIFI
jgi:hypothetical protein